MTAQRLQKVLAGAGIASRRRAEEIVAAGRVRVNGAVVTEMGVKVD
jgi:16S rRNA U516 pseudouridylate synthase RsuA-like enzyme